MLGRSKSFLHCQIEQSIQRTRQIVELEQQLVLFQRKNESMQKRISKLERENQRLNQIQKEKSEIKAIPHKTLHLDENNQNKKKLSTNIPHPNNEKKEKEILISDRKNKLRNTFKQKQIDSIRSQKEPFKSQAFINASRYLQQQSILRKYGSPIHLKYGSPILLKYGSPILLKYQPKLKLAMTSDQYLRGKSKDRGNVNESQSRHLDQSNLKTAQSQFYTNELELKEMGSPQSQEIGKTKNKKQENSPATIKQQAFQTQINKVENLLEMSAHVQGSQIPIQVHQVSRRKNNGKRRYLSVISNQIKGKEKEEEKGKREKGEREKGKGEKEGEKSKPK